MRTIAGALMILFMFGHLAKAADSFDCQINPKFSSGESLAKAVTDSLTQAKQRVLLALYGFNNQNLAEELMKVAKRGVTVRLKIDTAKGAEKKTDALIARLKSAGVEVQTVAPGGRNHNKFAVIDGTRVLTGSYNWTAKAESNWENLIALDCTEAAKRYESEWEKIH
jgi:mitochondrial cardiolipin hydrolase